MTRLLLVVLFACGAEAAPSAPEPRVLSQTPVEPVEDPEADVRCQLDAECVAATDACNGLVGVRRDRADDYERRMNELRPTVECSGLGVPGEWGERVGYCWEGRCRGADSGHRCTAAEECVQVTGPCSMYDVVNRAFEARVRERFEERAAVISCAAGVRAPELRVDCREGVCVGDIIN